MNKLKQASNEDKKRILEQAPEFNISAHSFLEELLPLLKEYFYGVFELEGDAITVCFINGKTFRITIQ